MSDLHTRRYWKSSPCSRAFAFARLRCPHHSSNRMTPKTPVSTANTSQSPHDHPTPYQPKTSKCPFWKPTYRKYTTAIRPALRQALPNVIRIATPSWPVRAGSFLFVMRSRVASSNNRSNDIFAAKIRRQLEPAIS